MVARTPPKQRKVLAPLNPLLLRETLKKVDRCMARLQELQYTVAGGNKMVSGVSLSPRSTRAYLKTSVRCKQETLRIKNADSKKSPGGKFPASTAGEWQRMSLPAMLLGETVGEILQASQFTKEIVATVTKNNSNKMPKTPQSNKKIKTPSSPLHENTDLKARRKREKLNKLQSIRSSGSKSPTLQRVRSRINFKVSPVKIKDMEKENPKYFANRVSPKHKPWAKKAVLFPNPLFLSTPSSNKFGRTKSPMIPHKFLIKSPQQPRSKFQVKIKSPPRVVTVSPTRSSNLRGQSFSDLTRKSPIGLRKSSTSDLRKKSPSGLCGESFSDSRKKSPIDLSKKSPKVSTASRLRRSFSPSRLASRFMSPLKSRKSVHTVEGIMMGSKQRPVSVPKRFSIGINRV